jgi:hypothetical protein
MRGKTAFGMAVILALVFGAVLAPNAFAEEEPPAPYWAECFKTSVKHTGKYEEKKCVKPSGSGKGNYELRPGIGAGGGFIGKSVGGEKPWLYMQTASGLIKVECTKGVDAGKYGLPNRVSDVVFSYGKCHGSGPLAAQKCTSPGASTGTIQFSPLSGELGYTFYKKESINVLVGALLESEVDPGGMITAFSCGPELEVKVSGQLIVKPSTLREASKHLTFTDKPSARLGEQEYNGKKYSPETNDLGWEPELHEIELGERPPHVLTDELCGSYIQKLEGEPCTPPLYMAIEQLMLAKGEPLMVVKYEGEKG